VNGDFLGINRFHYGLCSAPSRNTTHCDMPGGAPVIHRFHFISDAVKTPDLHWQTA